MPLIIERNSIISHPGGWCAFFTPFFQRSRNGFPPFEAGFDSRLPGNRKPCRL